jgi:hypothetical protein
MDSTTCYSGGDLFGAIAGTFIATLILMTLGRWMYLRYLLKKKGKTWTNG